MKVSEVTIIFDWLVANQSNGWTNVNLLMDQLLDLIEVPKVEVDIVETELV